MAATQRQDAIFEEVEATRERQAEKAREAAFNRREKELKRKRKREAQRRAAAAARDAAAGAGPPKPWVDPVRAGHLRTLGLDATKDNATAIRAAYRQLVLRYHPDKNSAPNAAEMFRAVKAASDALLGEEE